MLRDYLPFILMFLAGIAMIMVAQLGERLGWWNDVGLYGTIAGIVFAAVSVGVGVLYGASRPQVGALGLALAVGFRESHLRHDRTNERLDQTNERIGETNEHIGETNERIGETNERLGEGNQLLRDIRDRL